MCSNCSGDYENPDMTQWEDFETDTCTHTWPNGTPASHINLETCYVECAICGQPLADINYQFPPALRARRERSAA